MLSTMKNLPSTSSYALRRLPNAPSVSASAARGSLQVTPLVVLSSSHHRRDEKYNHTFNQQLQLSTINRRFFSSGKATSLPVESSYWSKIALLLAIAATTVVVGMSVNNSVSAKSVDYEAVRKDIEAILDDPTHDDGSLGPIFIRLAWHAAGTFDKHSCTGGSDGSTMRFHPEANHGANAGLGIARDRLEVIKQKHPEISYADLWSLAGVVAVEAMGGPKINWRPGRSDKPDGSHCTPDGRLPDAHQGANHVRAVFSRMGFTDKETVALLGAHAVGRCHPDRSGYTGPWTNSPTVFSNDYFIQLLENKWTKKEWSGKEQYEDPTKQLMMLPADLALIQDPEFKAIVQQFAKDEALFFREFASAFQKLEELGVKFPSSKPWWQFW